MAEQLVLFGVVVVLRPFLTNNSQRGDVPCLALRFPFNNLWLLRSLLSTHAGCLRSNFLKMISLFTYAHEIGSSGVVGVVVKKPVWLLGTLALDESSNQSTIEPSLRLLKLFLKLYFNCLTKQGVSIGFFIVLVNSLTPHAYSYSPAQTFPLPVQNYLSLLDLFKFPHSNKHGHLSPRPDNHFNLRGFWGPEYWPGHQHMLLAFPGRSFLTHTL